MPWTLATNPTSSKLLAQYSHIRANQRRGGLSKSCEPWPGKHPSLAKVTTEARGNLNIPQFKENRGAILPRTDAAPKAPLRGLGWG